MIYPVLSVLKISLYKKVCYIQPLVRNSQEAVPLHFFAHFQGRVLFHILIIFSWLCIFLLPPVPDPPSNVRVSQNRAGCVEVSWEHPSGGPSAICYTIYFQKDGEEKKSVEVESTATTAIIPDLITESTYSFTMVAISGTQIPSTESAAVPVTIIKGMFYTN